jgi:glycosyltransferase involved in cell wall biosynthesis
VETALVSVVIPVFDGARYLDATLDSVFAQTHRPIEVIVVDDGSTDDTPAVLARRPEAPPELVVIRQANAGAAAARNAGIALARGDFIALQDADDLWVPDKLAHQLAHLAAHPEHGYVAALVQSFLEPGVARPAWVTDAQLAEPRVGGVGNLLVRADVMRRVGPFSADDPTDFDWSKRAQDLGVTAGVVPEALLLRRVHDANLSYRLDTNRIRLAGLRAAIERQRGRAPT